MNKSVNIVLNSKNSIGGLSTTSNLNNSSYFVNLRNVLKSDKKYRLHWTYIGGQNKLVGLKDNAIATVYLDFGTNTITPTSGGATTTQFIGFLKPIVLVGSSNTIYFQAEDNTNLPIYLDSVPLNPTINVRVLDQAGNLYLDDTGAVSMTGSTASSVLTITAVSTGNIAVGSYLQLSAVSFFVSAVLTGTGGVGTYSITYAGTLISGTVSNNASQVGNPNAPYILTLKFTEEEDED